jgi:hypothetical protein
MPNQAGWGRGVAPNVGSRAHPTRTAATGRNVSDHFSFQKQPHTLNNKLFRETRDDHLRRLHACQLSFRATAMRVCPSGRSMV